MTTGSKRGIIFACSFLVCSLGHAATPMVAAGDQHTVFLKRDGTVLAVGVTSSWQEVKQWNKAGHYYTVQ